MTKQMRYAMLLPTNFGDALAAAFEKAGITCDGNENRREIIFDFGNEADAERAKQIVRDYFDTVIKNCIGVFETDDEE